MATFTSDQVIVIAMQNKKLKLKVENLTKRMEDIDMEKQALQTEVYKLKASNKIINDSLKTKEGELNTNIEDKRLFQEKCKKLEYENLKLKVEIINEAEAKNNIEKNMEKKEEELRSLQQNTTKSKSNLSRYESNEAVLKVIEMHDNLQRLNTEIFEITAALTKEFNDNQYNYEEKLEKYTIEYEKCKENLEKRHVKVSNKKFPLMVDHFRDLRRENERKKKEIFKIIYKLGKDCKDKLDKIQAYISTNSTSFKSYIDGQENILKGLKELSFLNDIEKEKKVFEDLLEAGEEEILLLINLYQASTQTTSTTSQNSDDADETIKKNLASSKSNFKMTNTSKSKSVSNLLSKDLYESDENAIIIFSVPESDTAEDDSRKIKFILSKFNVSEVEDVSRVGKRKNDDHVRSVKVVLKDQETVRHILEKSKKMRLPIAIRKFDKDFRKNYLELFNLK